MAAEHDGLILIGVTFADVCSFYAHFHVYMHLQQAGTTWELQMFMSEFSQNLIYKLSQKSNINQVCNFFPFILILLRKSSKYSIHICEFTL